jgi:3-phosphoshikimate 1-carboxyvinyltransferase
MQVRILPSEIGGTIAVPPSKSIAHRAVLCAALSDARCTISNLEISQDIGATMNAVASFGCGVVRRKNSAVIVPRGGFATICRPVDCGESGSTLRFLIPLFSLSGQPVTFIGHGRLMERPLSVYADLLPQHGTKFTQTPKSVTISGALNSEEYILPGNVSSQFVSGLLFALPLLEGPSTIVIEPPIESRSYIELTRSVQAAFGIKSRWVEGNTLYIPGSQRYRAHNFSVEGDFSQAAFPAVLGSLTGAVSLTGLPEKTLQGDSVFLDILKRCGAKGVRSGDALQFSRTSLSATSIDLADCPDLGPVLMALATCCKGVTTISSAARLRLKESDRIAAMEQELKKFGARISSTRDVVTIHGGPLHAPAAPLSSHNDHRIAMSLAVLALGAGVPATITDAQAVNKSWPAFWDTLRLLGAQWEETEDAEST